MMQDNNPSKLVTLFRKMWNVPLIRFGMVAGLNTAFGYSLYALLLTVGFHYVWATLIGQIIGIIFNFKTYGRLVFRNGDNRLVVKFVCVYAFTYLCNIIGIGYLVDTLGWSDYLAGGVMVIPIGLLTFILNKLLVFKKINNNVNESEQVRLRDIFKQWFSNKPRGIFTVLAAASLVWMIGASFDAGMSGDEETHNIHAKNVYQFYATMGANDTAAVMRNDYNLPSYGQAVDNFAYALTQWFNIDDVMQTRHTVNVIFAWLAMLYAALLAYRVGGRRWWPAIFTLALFFFSPRFMGHGFNDLKDSNLAAVMLIGLYYIVVFLQEFPKPRKTTLIMLGVCIGLSIAIRIGGLLLIAYFGLFALLFFIKQYGFKSIFASANKPLFWRNMVGCGLLVAAGGYILAVLLWPYALRGPIKNPMETFSSMSQFAISIRQLFEGKLQWSNQLPWYYTSKFILMTIPTAVILGAITRLFTGWGKRKKVTPDAKAKPQTAAKTPAHNAAQEAEEHRGFWTFVLLFCFVFPVFWITYTKANVYGGWRHSMFAYPSLVVLAGLGFGDMLKKCQKHWVRYVVIAVPFVLLWHPIRHYIKNHPYEYVYFNEWFGGVPKAYGQYELDYYYHSTRKAGEWIMAHADTSHLAPGEKIKVVSWHTTSLQYYLNDTAHFSVGFSRIYDMGDRDWDYAVFTVTGMNPDWITNAAAFPPSNTVYTVEVDHKPICIVLKRTDKSDFYGYEAMQRGEADSAVMYFRQALANNPYNEQALDHLSQLYFDRGNLDSALVLAAFWVQAVPSNLSALQQLANVYYARRDFANMLTVAQQIKEAAPTEMSGYYFSALAYLQMAAGNRQYLQLALNDLQKVVEYRPDFKPAYNLMAQIFQAVGDMSSARRCMEIVNRLP